MTSLGHAVTAWPLARRSPARAGGNVVAMSGLSCHDGRVAGVAIRRGALHDLPILRTIFQRSSLSNEGDRALLTEHPEFLELTDIAVPEGRTWIAEAEGRVVGFVTLRETASAAEVEDLFVDPDCMRRGIGRALIETIAGVAADRGWPQIEVDANPHAQEFYARTGFAPSGRVQLEHGIAMRMRRKAEASETGAPDGLTIHADRPVPAIGLGVRARP